jgi:hypothetical protein
MRPPFVGDSVRAFGIDITDAGEMRRTFSRQRRVNARVLLAQMSDANDCGA